ncbi:exocyst complex component protein [Lentinula edodes]|uniref:Exocyst complex component protein n=1 Tax=Lentinula edodes TaxID=5353 RepID=A0A1Q3DVN8_LENED|nr:exocyst complex component protein [Lentinula edodes]
MELDPAVEAQLQLSTFKGKFDVTEFVGGVSEKLIAQSKSDAGPFDPIPFIKTFEAAVDKLIAVRKEVQAKTEQMEKSVRVSEREYSKKMADLNRGFESVGNSFSGMESRMNEVSSTAIRIGEQLETVHIERQRAQAAYDIIDYYNQFSKGDTSRLDTLRKEGRQGRRQVAVLLRRLNTVAKEVDLPMADKTRENIEKYCEKFEKEMLNLFDRCYRKGDPKMMHHCAQTLLEFNGGSSCIQVYVNQHDFFINNVRESKGVEDSLLWSVISNPDTIPPKNEAGLTELFTEIRATVDTEAQIVKAVFPNPPVVMQVFLQRVFAQSIQQHVEHLLHRATAISDLAYLRVLQLAHIQTSILVEDLKVYELPASGSRVPFEAGELNKTLFGTTNVGINASTSLSTMLETAMEELFVPYTEGQRYLERESQSLGALYAGILVNFTRYHQAKAPKGKSSIFDRVVNQLSNTAATTSSGGVQTTSAQAANAILRFGGLNAEKNVVDEEPVREEDGQLSVDVAEKMLKWHAEAIGRCVELSAPNDLSRNTFALLRVLAEAISTAYIEGALETAQARLDASDPKAEPLLQVLITLRTVDLICHLWQHRLEGGVNQVMHRLADTIVAWLSSQLSKQKRNDFKPKNDDISFARVNTEPCVACCDMLEKFRDTAKANLSGKNLESFLTEIGISFHSLLLEHLRKFPVSATGGLMLAKDIRMYQDTISSFGIPSLTERFEFIRQLGQVFLLSPEILKSYITENYLGRIEPSLLKPYLAQRSDWGQFEKGFNDSGISVDGAVSDTAKSRFGRLSVMMKELEGLKLEGLRLSEGISVGIPTLPSGFTGTFSMSSRPFAS